MSRSRILGSNQSQGQRGQQELGRVGAAGDRRHVQPDPEDQQQDRAHLELQHRQQGQVDRADRGRRNGAGEARTEIHAGGRVLIVSSVLDLVGEEDWLHYSYRRELRCDGILIRERGWQRRYPRDAN